MVPEDQDLVRQDHSSSVGSTGGSLVGISSTPARSSPRHSGNGSHPLHGCVQQLRMGSPTRLTLDTGTVVCISKIVAHKRSGDTGRHQCCERLPVSSDVPGGSLDMRQRSHLHQERRGHMILHSHAADDTSAEVVRSQGDKAGSRPSARSAQCPGGCIVQDRPDSQHRMDSGNGVSLTSVCQVGRTTDRNVCYIRQQTTNQVCMAISGAQGRVDGRRVHSLGQREGPPLCVPAIHVGPSGPAEDTYSSSAGNSFLVSGASSQEDPIPLHVQGQPLLTQDVILSDGGMETRHYRPSNLHAWRLCGPS